MRIFKSIISCLMALCILFSFAGCKKGETEPGQEEKKTDKKNEEVSVEEIPVPDNSGVQLNITVAEKLEFYYLNVFSHTYQVAVTYDQQYGEGTGKMFTGYDVNLSPEEQTTKNEDGETVTFSSVFYERAIEQMAMIKAYYDLAVDNGIGLSEEDENEIEAAVSEYKKYGLCGVKFSDDLLRAVLTEQMRASNYEEFCQDNIRKEYDDFTTISNLYNEDRINYDVVSFRWFVIDYTDTAVAEAESFIKKITSVGGYSEETFKSVVLETVGEGNSNYEAYKEDNSTKIEKVDKETLEGNVGKDAADWFYETDSTGNYVRKNGEIKYFVSSDNKDVYILYATGTPFRDDTTSRSVRHILLMDSTKAEAQKVLDEYLAKAGSGVDEEYFIELVNKYTEDTGSKSNGGLIADMRNDGRYVSAFEDWAFSEGEFAGQERKPGTTGIVESEYGYHIMFYSSEYENPAWYEEILDELTDVEWEKINIEVDVEEFEKQNIDSETKANVIAKCIETIEKIFGFIA